MECRASTSSTIADYPIYPARCQSVYKMWVSVSVNLPLPEHSSIGQKYHQVSRAEIARFVLI